VNQKCYTTCCCVPPMLKVIHFSFLQMLHDDKYNEGSKGILERCGIFVYTLSTHYSSFRSINHPTPYSRYNARRWIVTRVGSVHHTYAVRAAAVSGGHPRSDKPPHPINVFNYSAFAGASYIQFT